MATKQEILDRVRPRRVEAIAREGQEFTGEVTDPGVTISFTIELERTLSFSETSELVDRMTDMASTIGSLFFSPVAQYAKSGSPLQLHTIYGNLVDDLRDGEWIPELRTEDGWVDVSDETTDAAETAV